MCVRPINAYIPDQGRPIFHPEGETQIACGKCHECINLRASHWGLRTQHELGDHNDNCCVTLTYDDKHQPDLTQRKLEFQNFMKRTRKRFKKKISVLVSHEFGSKNGRLHHHAILFGVDFTDKKLHKTTPKGTDLYTSRILTDLWSKKGESIGFCNIGEASAKTGHYIAAYALKSHTIMHNGELLTDSMDSSRSPAIGLNYLRRNHRQLATNEECLPRYYSKKMKEYGELNSVTALKILRKKGKAELLLMREMYDSYMIYEQKQNYNVRTQEEILTKYKIHRTKQKQDGELRKKPFTKNENMLYSQFNDNYVEYLSLEENNENTNRYPRSQS